MMNGRGIKLSNTYADAVKDIYEDCPKAVFAAIAVSLATCGGDHLDSAEQLVIEEWQILYDNGIVPQKPPSLYPVDPIDAEWRKNNLPNPPVS